MSALSQALEWCYSGRVFGAVAMWRGDMAAAGETVITHGEPHPGNVIRVAGQIMLVDWDTTLLAPPERDVWTLADGDPQVVDLYEATTGIVLLEDTLTLYRLRWDLTEISIYVGQFQQRDPRTRGVGAAHRDR